MIEFRGGEKMTEFFKFFLEMAADWPAGTILFAVMAFLILGSVAALVGVLLGGVSSGTESNSSQPSVGFGIDTNGGGISPSVKIGNGIGIDPRDGSITFHP